jgi:hypothetical protein
MPKIREYAGPYVAALAEFSWDSADAATTAGKRGSDITTIALSPLTAWLDGFVAAVSIDAVGGSFSALVVRPRINAVGISAADWAVANAATDRKVYLPTAVPFLAGQSIEFLAQSYTTFRDCVLTALLCFNVGDN